VPGLGFHAAPVWRGFQVALWPCQGNAQCRRKVPSGWNSNNNYWSATPSSNGHANVNLNNGNVNDNNDNNNNYVALQVL
jgi:hypothetical protein